MSLDMYNFIKENEYRLQYDLDKGLVITPKETNGTICSSTGYLRVKVNKKTLQVHQILAVKYFGESCVGMQINHKDGNKLNNSRNNLELSTQIDNIRHGWKNGLYENAKNNAPKGSNSVNGKLNDEQVKYIKNSEKSSKELALMFNVSDRTIRYVRSNTHYKEIS